MEAAAPDPDTVLGESGLFVVVDVREDAGAEREEGLERWMTRVCAQGSETFGGDCEFAFHL